MQYYPISVLVRTGKSQYLAYENVTVEASVKQSGLARPAQKVRLRIFDPAGKLVFTKTVLTNQDGLTAATFSLKKIEDPGNYSVEAHCAGGSLGLTSFLVF